MKLRPPPPAQAQEPIDGAAELAIMWSAIGIALRCARAAAPSAFDAQIRGFRAWASTTMASGSLTPGQCAAMEGALQILDAELRGEWTAAGPRAIDGDRS